MIPASAFTKPVHILVATKHYGHRTLVVSTSIRGIIDTISEHRPESETLRTLDYYYTGRIVDFPRAYVDRIRFMRGARACDQWSHETFRLFQSMLYSTADGEPCDVSRCSCVGLPKRTTKKFEPSCKICDDFEFLFKNQSIPTLYHKLNKGKDLKLPPVSSYKIGARIFQVRGGKHTNADISYLPKIKNLEDEQDILFLFTGRRHEAVPVEIRHAYLVAAQRINAKNANDRVAARNLYRKNMHEKFTLLLQELGYDHEKATELAKKVP